MQASICKNGTMRTRVDQVSVVIPAFRAAAHIEKAIASALAQTLPPLEIIVVDDASPDDTRRVVEAITDPRVRLVPLDRNVGASEARNRGVREARGAVIAFLDADDTWTPDKLARQLPALTDGTTLVTCDARIIEPGGHSWRFSEACPPHGGTEAWKRLLAQNFIPTPTVLCRRADLLALGGFDPGLTIGEDLDLWIRLAERGRVEAIPEVLVLVHAQPNGLMRSNPRGELDDVLPMIDRHLDRLQSRLGRTEYLRIRGLRAFEIAYRAYTAGLVREALPLFARAARSRVRVLKSLSFFPRGAVALLQASLRR